MYVLLTSYSFSSQEFENFSNGIIFIYAVVLNKSIFSVTVSPTRMGTWSWSLLVLSAQQVQYIFNE